MEHPYHSHKQLSQGRAIAGKCTICPASTNFGRGFLSYRGRQNHVLEQSCTEAFRL